MPRDHSCRTESMQLRLLAAPVRTTALIILFASALLPSAIAQLQGGPGKPLPAKSQPVASHEPADERDIADAILTDALDKLWDQADEHWHKGEYNHYINMSRIVVQGDPRNVEAFSNGAYLLWSTGRIAEATAFLKQGLAPNSDSYYMFDELGAHFYYHLKDYASALSYYEKAVQFASPYITWSGLAHCYEKMNLWEKAVTAWERATVAIPNGGADAQTQVSLTAQRNLMRAKAELAKRKK